MYMHRCFFVRSIHHCRLLESTRSLSLARGDFRLCIDLTFVIIVIGYDMFAAVRPSARLSLTSMIVIVDSQRLSSKQ
jgi:hypothetical protein